MKKYIFLLFSMAFAKWIAAQPNIEMGVKAGLSIPNLTTRNANNPLSSGYSSRFDGDAAIHAEYHFTKYFSLQPQLEYSSQGGKKIGIQAFPTPDELAQQFPPGGAPDYLYANYKSVAKLNYLLLPLLGKYRINLQKRWRIYVAVGPFISYLLNAKNITSGSSIIYLDKNRAQPLNPQPQSFNKTDNVTSDLHRFNSGISGHLGVDYKIGRGYLLLESGGNYGLVNIQKKSIDGKNRTGAAVINIGYQFSLQ